MEAEAIERAESPPEVEEVRIKEAAHRLGVHPNTVRNAVRKGKLPAEQRLGQWGRGEYAIRVDDLADFARRYYGRVLTEAPQQEQVDETCKNRLELYERITTLQEELGKFKSIAAVSESMEAQYKAQLAQLIYERNEAQQTVLVLTEELTAEKTRKGWLRRLF